MSEIDFSGQMAAASLDAEHVSNHGTATEILHLTETGSDTFLAGPGPKNHMGSIYGGRLVAQSLFAALRTVADLPLSSAHAYFLVPGLTSAPLEYRVTRLRDSKRFANRQVTAWQDGQVLFTLMCEFHAAEDGFAHQFAAMPDVPAPEDIAPLQQFVRKHEAVLDPSVIRNFSGTLPIEMRPVAPEAYLIGRPEWPERSFWFRQSSAGAIDDPRLHQCLLAFASDYWLAGVAAVPHMCPTNGEKLQISSMDHAIWFHRPARCDEWLLHDSISPSAGDGLGLALGRIFDRQGRLVASTAQECLLRRLDR